MRVRGGEVSKGRLGLAVKISECQAWEVMVGKAWALLLFKPGFFHSFFFNNTLVEMPVLGTQWGI